MNTYECFEKDNNKSLCEIETRLTIIETLIKQKQKKLVVQRRCSEGLSFYEAMNQITKALGGGIACAYRS